MPVVYEGHSRFSFTPASIKILFFLECEAVSFGRCASNFCRMLQFLSWEIMEIRQN